MIRPGPVYPDCNADAIRVRRHANNGDERMEALSRSTGRRTRSLVILAAGLLLPFAATPLVAQDQDAELDPSADQTSAEVEAATAAATEWLALIDAGEYGESWREAASAIQDAVTPAVWETSLTDARSQFEPFGERTLTSSQQMTDPPGAPAGDYVLLQYRTEVSGDRTVTETVVPMKEGDAWKVSGYFVHPE